MSKDEDTRAEDSCPRRSQWYPVIRWISEHSQRSIYEEGQRSPTRESVGLYVVEASMH